MSNFFLTYSLNSQFSVSTVPFTWCKCGWWSNNRCLHWTQTHQEQAVKQATEDDREPWKSTMTIITLKIFKLKFKGVGGLECHSWISARLSPIIWLWLGVICSFPALHRGFFSSFRNFFLFLKNQNFQILIRFKIGGPAGTKLKARMWVALYC